MWSLRRKANEPELPVLFPEPLLTQVRALLADGRRIEAVKLANERTGLGVFLAARAVDAIRDA